MAARVSGSKAAKRQSFLIAEALRDGADQLENLGTHVVAFRRCRSADIARSYGVSQQATWDVNNPYLHQQADANSALYRNTLRYYAFV